MIKLSSIALVVSVALTGCATVPPEPGPFLKFKTKGSVFAEMKFDSAGECANVSSRMNAELIKAIETFCSPRSEGEALPYTSPAISSMTGYDSPMRFYNRGFCDAARKDTAFAGYFIPC